jgi:hypothetical protein
LRQLRRAAVRKHPTLNGIDFLEVVDHATQRTAVHSSNLDTLTLQPSNVRIEGGRHR